MEGLWIHRALNVCVNDQLQLAELEKRGLRKGGKKYRVINKRKNRNGEESGKRGRVERVGVMYSD